MDAVIRVVAIYVFLMLVFRLSGKRTLGEATPFDLLLLLVISETTQQAMVDDDHSMTHAFLLILTFVVLNLGMSLLKQKSQKAERVLDGVPVILVDNGRFLKERGDKERVDEEDILEAARQTHGLQRMDQVKYAVLERDGKIAIVPKEGAGG
ncbi:MAG TPA: YetF domain-containing protein [Phycisphaerales bacterium]|nr:YetF domain-containing protein [Phycisphaerales bacterium]